MFMKFYVLKLFRNYIDYLFLAFINYQL